MSSQVGRRDPQGDGITLGKFLGRHANPGKTKLILLHVGRYLIGWGRFRGQARLPAENDDIAALTIPIEMERYLRMAGDMVQLVSIWLAVNEESLPIPPKPDRPGLGHTFGVNRSQPNDSFLFQPPGCAAAKFSIQVYHG